MSEGSRDPDPATLNSSSPPLNLDVKGQKMGEGAITFLSISPS